MKDGRVGEFEVGRAVEAGLLRMEAGQGSEDEERGRGREGAD